MKIILLTPALVAILGLALAGTPITAQAQTSTPTPAPDATAPTTDETPSDTTAPAPDTSSDTTSPKGGKKKSAKPQFKGSITAIDANSVTVASSQKTLTLTITPKTKFKVDTTASTASDFAVGDKVTGSYSTDSSGGMTANLLHKKSAGGGKGKKSAGGSSGDSSTPAAE